MRLIWHIATLSKSQEYTIWRACVCLTSSVAPVISPRELIARSWSSSTHAFFEVWNGRCVSVGGRLFGSVPFLNYCQNFSISVLLNMYVTYPSGEKLRPNSPITNVLRNHLGCAQVCVFTTWAPPVAGEFLRFNLEIATGSQVLKLLLYSESYIKFSFEPLCSAIEIWLPGRLLWRFLGWNINYGRFRRPFSA